MKKIFYLILFSFFPLVVFSQNDSLNKPTIGVVSADKLNVVYRGVLNPISIAVPNCKSFTATAPGLTKTAPGKYSLAPGVGLYTIIKLNIVLKDGSKITEEHKFRIKGYNAPIATINDRSCSDRCILEMTKEELFEATIGFSLSKDFLFDISSHKIIGFIIKTSDTNELLVNGNKFNKEVTEMIKGLKTGSIFSVTHIYYSFPGSENYSLPRLAPIKIMIVEKETEE